MDALLAIFSDWPHLLLLGGATLGGVLVGVGILKESKSWAIATILVLIGVIIEPIFTLGLFVYDENISRKQLADIKSLTQKNEILSLEAAPRRIDGAKFLAALSKAKKAAKVELRYQKDLPEPWWFAERIFVTLTGTAWQPSWPTEIGPDDLPQVPSALPSPPLMSGILLLAKRRKDFDDPTSAAGAMAAALAATANALNMQEDSRLPDDTLKVLISARVMIVYPTSPKR